MKIAVTGANGFLGKYVVPLLSKSGFDVIAVVRNLSKSNELSRYCRLVKHEIGKQDEHLITKLGQPDILLHLAWGGLPHYRDLYHFETELPNQYRFLKIMVESGIRSIAVVGTCFEYGMQSGELSESLESKPNNPYGYAKDALRKQLQFLQNEYDFMLTWMRLFYIYGEGQPENTLFSQFNTAVLNSDPVFNMSAGEQLRDYLAVTDVAEKIKLLMLLNENVGVVNVCNGEPVSVRSLVEKWSSDFKTEISLNLGHYEYPSYEPMAFWGDKTKFDSVLSKGDV